MMRDRLFAILAVAGLLGCNAGAASPVSAEEPPVKVEFRRAQDVPAPDYTARIIRGTTETVYVHKQTELTNEDIAEAGVDASAGRGNRPGVWLKFTPEGRAKMGKLTQEQIGKKVAVLVDGNVVYVARVLTQITEMAFFDGDFTKAEAERIARGIIADPSKKRLFGK
jgi:preprotein translocase subunit SecD